VINEEYIEEVSERRRLRSGRSNVPKSPEEIEATRAIKDLTDGVLDDKIRTKIYERNHKIVQMEQ
jgi:hypothetical protein